MPRRNKFNARKTKGSDSKAEHFREVHLRQLDETGSISALHVKPPFDIAPVNCEPLRYTPDFAYVDVEGMMPGSFRGAKIAEDVKGMMTAEFVIRAKLFLAKYPDFQLLISKAIYRQVKGKRKIVGFRLENFKHRRLRKCRPKLDHMIP